MPYSFYIIKKGDTLFKIAKTYLGDGSKWKALKQLNKLVNENLIFIGQKIKLPIDEKTRKEKERVYARNNPSITNEDKKDGAAYMIARGALFIVVEEILSRDKLVRKIWIDPQMPPTMLYPEKYGIEPLNKNSKVSIGEHALGNTKSRYTSTSSLPKGAPNFKGRPVFIDVKKITKAGCKVHSSEAIVADLKRIKAEQPASTIRIDKLIHAIRNMEQEVLVEGKIPSAAVKSELQMKWIGRTRVLGVIGVVASVYDVTKAAKISIETQKPNPLVAEAIRQAGGWGAGIAGAKVGGVMGAMVTAETGPGAIIGGLVGSIIFGIAGYAGADWIADYIHEN